MNEIFKPHEECAHPRTVLIEGEPGKGKTTFCNKYSYEWAKKEQGAENPFFPNCGLVLLLQCRQIRSYVWEATDGQLLPRSKEEKAEEILKSVLWDAIDAQLLPQHVTREDKEGFFEFIRHNQRDILLVLDGLDELPANMLAVFTKVIEGRMLPKCHIVVTARQEVGMEVRECCDSLLEIEGFTKDDAREFIVKYFKENAHLADTLLVKLTLDENLRQLTESPLNTVLLCLLWEDFNGIFPESGTQLYLEIVECVLRRYRKRKELSLPKANGEDLTKVYKTQLKQLGSIALNGLLQNKMSFGESEFKLCAGELREFGFLSVEYGSSTVRPSLNYCFLHKTFQELFAAFYLFCLVLDKEKRPENLIADEKYFHELNNVLTFTCGLLALQSEEAIKGLITCIANQVNNTDKLLIVLKCVRECKNEKSCTLHMQLARTLGSLLQITHFNFFNNHLKAGDCDILAEAIKHNSAVTQLNLSGNGFGYGDCTALAETITQNSTITQLNLSANYLGVVHFIELAEAIKGNSTITQLDLSGNGLGYGDCTKLAKAIKHNSTITQLDLSGTGLGYGDFATLAQRIKNNSTITQLNLSDNDLGDGDCTSLREVITHNSTITQLNLSGNRLGVGKCTGVKHNSSRTQLYLTWNRLGAGVCTALAEAIKRNSTITHLDLSDNRLGDGQCAALMEAIKENSTILRLDFIR